MPFLTILLLPFALLYQWITSFRNWLYENGYKNSTRFDTTVISVGNLNVGGSGKTPMVEYLVRLLADEHTVAILSRGYGRKTKGFRLGEPEDNATSLGDEPYQYYRKWHDNVTVAVGEKRAPAITRILEMRPSVNVVLLDDAFQHRAVTPALSILLTDYSKPFYKDYVLPAGRLRESRQGAHRATIIVVTKCPDHLGESEREAITKRIQYYAGSKPVFFTQIAYQVPVAFAGDGVPQKRIILVSGIANSLPLETYLATRYDVVRHFKMGDHHNYTTDGVNSIRQAARDSRVDSIVTTEKDMVKLISTEFEPVMEKEKWFYVPVESRFLINGSEFDALVKSKL